MRSERIPLSDSTELAEVLLEGTSIAATAVGFFGDYDAGKKVFQVTILRHGV